jgi:thiamine biosynthesis lipoprotein
MRGLRAQGFAIAATCALACASPRSESLPLFTASATIDGVALRVTARDPDEVRARTALSAALDAARQVASLILVQHEGSEIDVLMRVPSHLWIEISATTGETLLMAFAVADATDGAYDPTCPPLLELWGLESDDTPHTPHTPHTPQRHEVERILRRVDWNDVEVRHEGSYRARRKNRRTEIDLGAAGRGAMLDAALAALRRGEVPAGRASTLSEHAVYGGTFAQPWSIEVLIRSEVEPAAEARAGAIELQDGAVGVASRGPVALGADGTRIHDRFDARSGYPATGIRWLAVVTETASSAAGAWADAIFALGADGANFVGENDGLRAVIRGDDGELRVSPGLRFSESPR